MNTTSIEQRSARWPILLLAVFLVSPVVTSRLDPAAYAGGRSRNVEARALRNTSAVAAMLGEFRTGMSDMIYVKTERYLHSGIGYDAHLQKQLLSVSGALEEADAQQAEHEASGHGEDCEHNHDAAANAAGGCEDGTPTLIRPASEDYRGFIGELHRRVKPWRDPSQHMAHTDGTEVLPWYRVMTVSDPHYVRGYTLGGWWLKSRNPDQALSFIQEGIEKNPDAFQLYLVRGQVLYHDARDRAGGDMANPDPEVLAQCLEARAAYRRAAELALVQRPRGWTEESGGDDWSIYLEEDIRAATHMAVFMERQYGDRTDAKRLAARYHAQLPDDPLLARLAREDS
jgi:hypothetical protein